MNCVPNRISEDEDESVVAVDVFRGDSALDKGEENKRSSAD